MTKARAAKLQHDQRQAKDVESERAAKRAARPPSSSASEAKGSVTEGAQLKYAEYDRLVSLYTKMKAQAGTAQQENAALRANASRLSLSNQKLRVAIDKLKKLMPNPDRINAELASIREDKSEQHRADVRLSVNAFLRRDAGALAEPVASDPPPVDLETYTPVDPQLREMLIEFNAIQNVRKALVSRILAAKAKIDAARAADREEQEKMRRALSHTKEEPLAELADFKALMSAYQRQLRQLAIAETRSAEYTMVYALDSEATELEAARRVLEDRLEAESKISVELQEQLANEKLKLGRSQSSSRLFDLRHAVSSLYTAVRTTMAADYHC